MFGYSAEQARKDMNEYNDSLEKALSVAESRIKEAASKGYSACSLSKVEVKHRKDVAHVLVSAGYVILDSQNDFAVSWYKQ